MKAQLNRKPRHIPPFVCRESGNEMKIADEVFEKGQLEGAAIGSTFVYDDFPSGCFGDQHSEQLPDISCVLQRTDSYIITTGRVEL